MCQTLQTTTSHQLMIIIFIFAFILCLPFYSSNIFSRLSNSTRNKSGYGASSPLGINRVENNNGSSSNLMGSATTTCDMFDGIWVYDDHDPVYKPGSCTSLGDRNNCFQNGRLDVDYLKYRWQPYGCDLPRFDGKKMMEMFQDKRMVFIGDSIIRNMWNSLICSLASFNISGTNVRKDNNTHFQIKDYNCTITLVTAVFLAEERKDFRNSSKSTLQLDIMSTLFSEYYDADVLIFDTGHWWIDRKTQNGENFFQEGNVLHEKMEIEKAYRITLNTWARWVDKNVNKDKTQVFFLGYSSTTARLRGIGNMSRACEGETEPITNNEQLLQPRPWTMIILEEIMSNMTTPVNFLNITKLTAYRKDAHPSIYGKTKSIPPRPTHDCLHWCLPGVPDTWNQMLYAILLSSFKPTN